MNSILAIASIGIALCLAVWATATFAKRLRNDEEPLLRKIRQYVKELFDALWGAG